MTPIMYLVVCFIFLLKYFRGKVLKRNKNETTFVSFLLDKKSYFTKEIGKFSMKRRFLLYFVCFFSLYAKGQHTIEGITKNTSLNPTTVHSPIPTTKQLRSFFRVDYLTVPVPIENNISNMGLSGGHYNVFLNDWLYTGFGMYGAVSGDLGGLFTLGVEAGIKYRMAEKLFFDAGIYFGGGGGHSAPVGGGAFIVSSVGLGYDFKSFSIGTAYSSANFYEGSINGSQLKVFIDIPLDFKHASYTCSKCIAFRCIWCLESRRSGI